MYFAMTLASLPPASSGLFLETSLRRTLALCSEVMGGDCKGREDLKNWKRSPVFHHYVDTLQDQVAELGRTAGPRIDPDVIRQYQAHVDAIATQLEKSQLPAGSPVALGRLPAVVQNGVARSPQLPLRVPDLPPVAANGHRSGDSSGTQGAIKAPSSTTAEAQAVQPPVAAAAAAVRPPPPSRGSAPALPSQGMQSRLQTQSNLQETLTDELAGMAASLKSSTLAVEGKLKERGQLLDATETALDHSLQHTRHSAAEAKKIHSKGRVNFCLTFLVMLVVGLLFAGTYVFIKFTSFAGYKAVRPQAAAAGGEL